MLGRLQDVFEPGSLYVELQDHGLPEQPILNGMLGSWRKRARPPARRDQRRPLRRSATTPRRTCTCRASRRAARLAEAKERHHGSSEMYLKSPDEMAQRFAA